VVASSIAALGHSPLMEGVTAMCNYVPWKQDVDLGLGMLSTYTQQLSRPQLPWSVVMRAATAPYSEGLLLQVCLAPEAAARLRGHPMLAQLLPEARWVGG